jgi:hypothetical protein
MKLLEWIKQTVEAEGRPIDIDLYHDEYELDREATMSEVSLGSFTPEGLKHWDDVLSAEVVKAGARGTAWYGVIVSGVRYKRVQALQWAQSGYCSSEDFDKWFVI